MIKKLFDTDEHTMITRTIAFFLSGLTGYIAWVIIVTGGLSNSHRYPYEDHIWNAVLFLNALVLPFCLLIAIAAFIFSKKHIPAFFASGFSLFCGIVFAPISLIPLDFLCEMNLMNTLFGL